MSASRERKLRQNQADTVMTEKQKAEAKQAKTLKIQTGIFIAVCVVMLAVLLVYGVLSTGIVEKNITALTVGEHKITAAEMNYFYVNQAYDFYDENASFLSYLIDPNTPVDEQVLVAETGETWADQFMDQAMENARDTYAVYDKAVAEGFTLTEAQQASIDSTVDSLKVYAQLSGASSANAYLRSFYGRGCTTESYRHYLTVQQTVAAYASAQRDAITWTDEDMAAYEAENGALYNSYDYRYYYVGVLDYCESDDPSDDEVTAATAKAEAAADSLLASAQKGEGAFIAKAAEVYAEKDPEGASSYDPDSSTLYSNTLYNAVNTKLVDWITDSSRASGDAWKVASTSADADGNEVTNGYYVVLFLDSTDNSDVFTKDVRHILISGATEESKAKAEELLAQYEADPTEDNFAALATENSADSTASAGGLIEAIEPGQTVDAFDSWCFDESRKPGDTGIVESEYGYHVMYFVGNNISYRQAMLEEDYRTDLYDEWYSGITDAVSYTPGSLSWVNTGIYLRSTNSSN